MTRDNFACKPGCTQCCRGKGSVLLNTDDVLRIADYLHVATTELYGKYIERVADRTRMVNPCLFLTDAGCSIHSAKPYQCASFPFWPELLGSKEAWNRAAERCPGMVRL
jgi:Fe-S-cluster containining protein